MLLHRKETPMSKFVNKIKNVLSNERGEGAFLDVVIIAVIIIVIGCLLMALIKKLYEETVFPKFTSYINKLFGATDGYISGAGSLT